VIYSELDLRVQFASKTRLNVRILPAEISKGQESWYDVKQEYLARTPDGDCFNPTHSEFDFRLTTSPFEFGVVRKSTGDVLFSTKGSKLVFENQFVEFRTVLPPNYNISGLGEVMHKMRLGNNYNRTLYSADVASALLSSFLRPLD
jgi:alpha-glucosidase